MFYSPASFSTSPEQADTHTHSTSVVMGQTLTSAAQWTTATEDGRQGKLELTKTNEVILNKIIAFVDGFSSRHSDESDLAFKQSLTWTTELTESDFSSGFTQKYGFIL